MLFGDSHAIQWFDAFRRIADDSGWHLVTMLKSGCPAYDFAPGTITIGTAGEENCRAWRRAAIAEIARLQPQVVAVGSATVYFDAAAASGDDLERWRQGATRTYDALRRSGTHVAALRDTPQPGFDVPTCLARARRNSWYPGGDCSFGRDASIGSRVYEVEMEAAGSDGG